MGMKADDSYFPTDEQIDEVVDAVREIDLPIRRVYMLAYAPDGHGFMDDNRPELSAFTVYERMPEWTTRPSVYDIADAVRDAVVSTSVGEGYWVYSTANDLERIRESFFEGTKIPIGARCVYSSDGDFSPYAYTADCDPKSKTYSPAAYTGYE